MKNFVTLESALLGGHPVTTTSGPVRVYLLVDPQELTVRYVGVTVSPERRLEQHMMGTQSCRAMRLWVAGLRLANLRAKIHVVSWCSPEQWADQEKAWIAYLRSKGALYNIHEGGGDRVISSAEKAWRRLEERRSPARDRRPRPRRKSLYEIWEWRPLKPPGRP